MATKPKNLKFAKIKNGKADLNKFSKTKLGIQLSDHWYLKPRREGWNGLEAEYIRDIDSEDGGYREIKRWVYDAEAGFTEEYGVVYKRGEEPLVWKICHRTAKQAERIDGRLVINDTDDMKQSWVSFQTA